MNVIFKSISHFFKDFENIERLLTIIFSIIPLGIFHFKEVYFSKPKIKNRTHRKILKYILELNKIYIFFYIILLIYHLFFDKIFYTIIVIFFSISIFIISLIFFAKSIKNKKKRLINLFSLISSSFFIVLNIYFITQNTAPYISKSLIDIKYNLNTLKYILFSIVTLIFLHIILSIIFDSFKLKIKTLSISTKNSSKTYYNINSTKNFFKQKLKTLEIYQYNESQNTISEKIIIYRLDEIDEIEFEFENK